MATSMMSDLFDSSADEKIAELQYLLQCPKEREKAISFLLEDPRDTLVVILGLCTEICEKKDWPFCSKVSFLSKALDVIKREPKLLQFIENYKIKAFDEMLKSSRKKIGPHARGCSMCFAPPMQYFNTCSMLANKTNY